MAARDPVWLTRLQLEQAGHLTCMAFVRNALDWTHRVTGDAGRISAVVTRSLAAAPRRHMGWRLLPRAEQGRPRAPRRRGCVLPLSQVSGNHRSKVENGASALDVAVHVAPASPCPQREIRETSCEGTVRHMHLCSRVAVRLSLAISGSVVRG